MSLREIFKETQDYMGIKSSDLADQVGRSRKHISEFRTGKSSPPIDELDRYLEAGEELAPGFKREFARRLAGVNFFCASPAEVVNGMSSQEISALLFAIANKVQNKGSYSTSFVSLKNG